MKPDDGLLRVWDLPTRIFHWTLVLLVALQFASAEFGWPRTLVLPAVQVDVREMLDAL